MQPLHFILFFSEWAASLADVETFSVYSEPVELRYGEVHNKVQFGRAQDGLRLPEHIVEKYSSGEELMAISGFDIEMVRRAEDGSETPVKLSDHYLHHYILYFGQAKTMSKMADFVKHDPHAAHMLTSCHGMTGAGTRMFEDHLASIGDVSDHSWVSFGSASGAEFRHNPQRFVAPFRLLLKKPEVWAPVLHIINTNLADNRTDVITGAYVSRLLECPCTPQRRIDIGNGTIDGRRPEPAFGCSKAFAATGNPACHLSTYVGGWRCCEHGMFLVDTDKECRSPRCAEKPLDKIFMKFTFYHEKARTGARNVEASACCDVTGDSQGFQNIEYDVMPCAAGTPAEQCVHVAESVQRAGVYRTADQGKELVDLVFAAPHLHWAGNSIELIDNVTNRTLCEVHRTHDNNAGVIYGKGSEAGDERDYLVGLIPCTFGDGEVRLRRDHPLRTRAVYNATRYHTGVMGLWLMEVSAVPVSEYLVV